MRVLLPNRPRALLLRGGWASKRFLVVVRDHRPSCWHVVIIVMDDYARSAVMSCGCLPLCRLLELNYLLFPLRFVKLKRQYRYLRSAGISGVDRP